MMRQQEEDQPPGRRLAGIDPGIVSRHSVRVLEADGGQVCRSSCVPTANLPFNRHDRASASLTLGHGERAQINPICAGTVLISTEPASAQLGGYWSASASKPNYRASRKNERLPTCRRKRNAESERADNRTQLRGWLHADRPVLMVLCGPVMAGPLPAMPSEAARSTDDEPMARPVHLALSRVQGVWPAAAHRRDPPPVPHRCGLW